MNVFVDTSVWSLAWRRDAPPEIPEVRFLERALDAGDTILTTGLVLQELLQGFRGPRAGERIIKSLTTLPFLVPERQDHIDAARLRNRCRRKGIRVGTIGALLAQLCIHHELQMLTADADFRRVARHTALSLVTP